MAYTLDEMARALARRKVMETIVKHKILIFDLNELETAVTGLMEHENFYPDALFYINEWARLDFDEASPNVIPL